MCSDCGLLFHPPMDYNPAAVMRPRPASRRTMYANYNPTPQPRPMGGGTNHWPQHRGNPPNTINASLWNRYYNRADSHIGQVYNDFVGNRRANGGSTSRGKYHNRSLINYAYSILQAQVPCADWLGRVERLGGTLFCSCRTTTFFPCCSSTIRNSTERSSSLIGIDTPGTCMYIWN